MPLFGKRYEIKRTRAGRYLIFDIEEHAFVPDADFDTIADAEKRCLAMNAADKA